MSRNWKQIGLMLLAGVLLAGVFQVQESMNAERDALGLTRVQPLENAPPVLAFTTVALGGFRGLISNILWIRATDLQDDDKYFEMAQLADWITKLEPHFVQVWLVQAWNMAYNISVKFKDFPDRWRWVERGLELLRDDGLRYNPNETLLYRELAWFFQHKLGANMDDANMYYKQEWANEMAVVFDKKAPDLEPLIHPRTPDEQRRASLLRDKYKMDPEFMKVVNERYGPLEWRLPESHAIYWAALGLRAAERNPAKIKPDDLITLRRVIYQSMQTSFQRGRLVANPFMKSFEFGPNLDIIPKVSAAYEEAAHDDEKNRDHIETAHKNFLKDAVYFLYEGNRINDAANWYKYLGTKFPNSTLLDYRTNSFARNLTLDEYAVSRAQEDVNETMSRDRVKAVIEGLLVRALTSLAVGEDDRSAGFKLLAGKVRDTYSRNTQARADALAISPLDDIQREVLNRMLDPQDGVPPEMRAVLRTKLNLGPEPASNTSQTNSVPESVSSK